MECNHSWLKQELLKHMNHSKELRWVIQVQKLGTTQKKMATCSSTITEFPDQIWYLKLFFILQLSKYVEVDREGNYKKKGDMRIFYSVMLETRVSLVKMAPFYLTRALQIGVRYAAVRR